MSLNKSARNQALILIFLIVPVLMFGLGASGFLIAKVLGLGNTSIVIALVLSTIGFALSIVITLRMGKQYEKIHTEGEKPASTAVE